MKEKIEIGEYVRTCAGNIIKVVSIEDDKINEWVYYCFIKKHSYDWVDLIEVGDIAEIRTGLYSSFKYFVENEDNLLLLKEKVKQFWNIETILTHEQYDRYCFKELKENE